MLADFADSWGFGSTRFGIVVVAFYLFTRAVERLVKHRTGEARSLSPKRVSGGVALLLLGLGTLNLSRGLGSSSALRVTLGVLLVLASLDALQRWRREERWLRQLDRESRARWYAAPRPKKREPF